MMFLNGTSMAAPVVAGAAALLLQMNPKLTPNMVKAILMYTAQPLNGASMFEQGAGELNIEGAVRLAKLVRTDLTSTTPLGTTLLTTTTLPTPQSTIVGSTFTWSQGLILGRTWSVSTDFIRLYQKVYNAGALLSDGIQVSSGTQVVNTTMMTSGILLGDSVMTSDGTTLSGGSPLMSTGILLADGTAMADQSTLADGILLSDGILLADGALWADVATQASDAMINGDNTAGMTVVKE